MTKKEESPNNVDNNEATEELSTSAAVSELGENDLQAAKPIVKDTMTIREVLAFCMPAGKQHSCTTNRLYLLAETGPLWNMHSYLSCLCIHCQKHVSKQRKTNDLCANVMRGEIYSGEALVEAWEDFLCEKCKIHLSQTLHLRAGFKCKSIVNDLQINEMARQVEKDDILNAYHRNNDGATLEEQHQFLSLIKREPNVKDACRNLTRSEIVHVFEEFANGPEKLDKPMSYYDARKAILDHRAARVRRLGLMYGENKKNPKKAPFPKPVPHAARVGEVPGGLSLSTEMRKLYGRQEDMRLSHAHMFEIAHLKDQNTIGLTANNRLLRNLNRETNAWKTLY